MIVELNGARLRPGNSNYFTGDGTTNTFSLPTSADDDYNLDIGKIQVWMNGEKANVSDYNIVLPNVVFTQPPENGADISITYTAQAEYTYNESTKTVTIINTVPVPAGSLLAVTAFSNHDPYKFKTKVFKGVDYSTATVNVEIGFGEGGFSARDFDNVYTVTTSIGKRYSIDSDQNNAEKVFVHVNGKVLIPSFDYTVSNGFVYIADTILIDANTIIVVTWMDTNTFVSSSTFRMFKDLNENISFNRVSVVDATILEKDLLITDDEIHVENADVLGTPDLVKNVPGVLFIDSERITFWRKEGNVLSGIRRGTAGTAANTVHTKGAVVVDGSGKSEVPNAKLSTWYNTTELAPSDGKGLMLSNTIQANFLKESMGIIPFLRNT